MASDDDDVIICDASCYSVPSTSSGTVTETNSLKSCLKRPISVDGVIEILDSDEEIEEPKVTAAIPTKRHKPGTNMDPDKLTVIQAVINEITQTYSGGKNVEELSAPTVLQELSQILGISTHQSGDFYALRNVIVESGLISLLFKCLSVYTHHVQETVVQAEVPQPSTSKAPPKRGRPKATNRWSKAAKITKGNGTGYGTGVFASEWNVKKALSKQQSEDIQITALLRVLASYINPNDDLPTEDSAQMLPPAFVDLIEQSCLLPVLRSYLRNDSVFDMTQHIPLYKAIALLVRAISTSNQLVHLLMLKQDDADDTVTDLLAKIKVGADSYEKRVK
jgi:hypothetical protein